MSFFFLEKPSFPIFSNAKYLVPFSTMIGFSTGMKILGEEYFK